MDWGRAKTILIVSFLFLNMILAYQLWTTKTKQTDQTTDITSLTEELNLVLHSKNIRVTGEIPKEMPKLKEITVKFDESIRSNEKLPLLVPINMANILGKTKASDSQAWLQIPKLDRYQYDLVASKNGVYVFNQLYNLLPMFEVKVEMFENNGEITSYRQTYVEVESGGEQKEQTVIAAQLALRSLAANYLPEGSVIKDISLGYRGQLYNSQTQYMVPSWRIAMENGDIYYVLAFNGEVVIPQKGTESGSELPDANSTKK
jgi:regulatory protein YycI of two-component signal transduction system YycFG